MLPEIPTTLTYDNRTGAHGVGCVTFPDGFALDTAGGPGGDPRVMPAFREAMMREVCRRWNAHAALVAALERIVAARDNCAETGEYGEPALEGDQSFDDWAADVAAHALALSRGGDA